MHPADRYALAAVACFAAGVVTLAPVVWRSFEGRALAAVFAVVATVCFITVGWVARSWALYVEQEDP